jgi:hypothetical protein
MHHIIRRFSLALGLVFAAHFAHAQLQRPDAIVVTHTEAAYVLEVPVSKLLMVIPEAGLKHEAMNLGGSTSNPRYYNFSDLSRGLIISGWFEPASRFSGLTTFWETEQASWKKGGLPEAQNVSVETIGNWQAIFYDLTLPVGSNHHVRAHLVQAGTWIDIHISVTGVGATAPDRATLETILKSISVNEKPGG